MLVGLNYCYSLNYRLLSLQEFSRNWASGFFEAGNLDGRLLTSHEQDRSGLKKSTRTMESNSLYTRTQGWN